MAKWNFDPDHTVAAFAVQHLGIARVRGQFNKISGWLIFDSASPADSELELSVDVSSLYTGIRKRDVHLVSPDFFDAVKQPGITFRSSGCAMAGGSGRITGNLTIRGVSRPVTFEAQLTEPLKLPADFGGETTIGLAMRATISREDFGLVWNVPLGDGGVLVGKEVELTLDGEADREE